MDTRRLNFTLLEAVFLFVCFFCFFFLMSDLIYLLLLEHLIFDWTQK